MRTARRMRGDCGEALVAHSLEKAGFSIVARNYQKKFGEIDLIAERQNLLLFVEVKTRTRQFFDLTELITPAKQKKIIAAAKAYIVEHHVTEKMCRFDVALVESLENGIIRYIPNAFTDV
jgi:putative endonuclease